MLHKEYSNSSMLTFKLNIIINDVFSYIIKKCPMNFDKKELFKSVMNWLHNSETNIQRKTQPHWQLLFIKSIEKGNWL